MNKLSGSETAIVHHHKLLAHFGKYRLYKVKLRVHERYFLLDHPAHAQYYSGLKRITNNFFIHTGRTNE